MDKFKNKVLNQCFSKQVLTTQVMRNNARQARGFMIGYLMLHASLVNAGKGNEDKEEEGFRSGVVSIEALKESIDHIPCEKIKKARKAYKRHRGIAVFESSNSSISYRMPIKLE